MRQRVSHGARQSEPCEMGGRIKTLPKQVVPYMMLRHDARLRLAGALLRQRHRARESTHLSRGAVRAARGSNARSWRRLQDIPARQRRPDPPRRPRVSAKRGGCHTRDDAGRRRHRPLVSAPQGGGMTDSSGFAESGRHAPSPAGHHSGLGCTEQIGRRSMRLARVRCWSIAARGFSTRILTGGSRHAN
jgi:hypothetical protein